jgi:hypothetical protein
MNQLGLTHKYGPVVLLEEEFELVYDLILGQNPILILRIRFHEKAPILNE